MFIALQVLACIAILSWAFYFRFQIEEPRRHRLNLIFGLLYLLIMIGTSLAIFLPPYLALQSVKKNHEEAMANWKGLDTPAPTVTNAPVTPTPNSAQFDLSKLYPEYSKPAPKPTDPRAEQPAAGIESAPWSALSNGLKGRVVLKAAQIKPGEFFSVEIEVKNEGGKDVSLDIGNPHPIQMEVLDAAGKSVPATLFRSDVLFSTDWKNVPDGGVLSFPITHPNTDAGKDVNLDTTTQLWKLPTGKYSLQVTLSTKGDENLRGPANRWIGTLKLPAVNVEVVEVGK